MREMSKLFIVLDIGCLECGEESHVVAIYPSEEEAKESVDRYYEKMGGEEYTRNRVHSIEVHSFIGAGQKIYWKE
jgi:hypothetical protein